MLLPALNHIGSGHNPIVIALLCAVTQTPAQPGRQSSVLMSKPREWHAKSGKTSVSAFLINYKIWTDSRPCQEQHFPESVSFFYSSSSLRIGGNCFNVGGEHDPTENRNVSLFRLKGLFLCEFELSRKWKEWNWQASSPFNIFTIC